MTRIDEYLLREALRRGHWETVIALVDRVLVVEE